MRRSISSKPTKNGEGNAVLRMSDKPLNKQLNYSGYPPRAARLLQHRTAMTASMIKILGAGGQTSSARHAGEPVPLLIRWWRVWWWEQSRANSSHGDLPASTVVPCCSLFSDRQSGPICPTFVGTYSLVSLISAVSSGMHLERIPFAPTTQVGFLDVIWDLGLPYRDFSITRGIVRFIDGI